MKSNTKLLLAGGAAAVGAYLLLSGNRTSPILPINPPIKPVTPYVFKSSQFSVLFGTELTKDVFNRNFAEASSGYSSETIAQTYSDGSKGNEYIVKYNDNGNDVLTIYTRTIPWSYKVFVEAGGPRYIYFTSARFNEPLVTENTARSIQVALGAARAYNRGNIVSQIDLLNYIKASSATYSITAPYYTGSESTSFGAVYQQAWAYPHTNHTAHATFYNADVLWLSVTAIDGILQFRISVYFNQIRQATEYTTRNTIIPDSDPPSWP